MTHDLGGAATLERPATAAGARCAVPGCGRAVANKTLGYCHAHEVRYYRAPDGDVRPDVPIRGYVPGRGSCRDCGDPVGQQGGHGRCVRCLAAWRRAGCPAD